MSSILHKNELESKKLKNHYEERFKDLSEERDQLMKDVLESKFKIENQKFLIERLKVTIW
jgi:flagellar motility protein MotE (MotC chaperone)